ncbi:hypothetical protein JCM6882_002959 [Rhodosporidiobolus microsporus]
MAAQPQMLQLPTSEASSPPQLDDVPSISSNNNPTSSRLTRALALQQQLRDRLEQSSIELAARRRADELVRERKEGRENSRERRVRFVERVQRLKAQVQEERGKRVVRERVADAMDRSQLVTAHLFAESAPQEPTKRQVHLQSLLTTRDSLALQLLQAQNAFLALSSERSQLRKKLLVLNRKNAALVAELRSVHQPPEELIERLPTEVREYYNGLQSDSLLIHSRLSIIRNVFQRLVADSGVPVFPASSPLFRTSPSSNSDPSPDFAALLAAPDGGEEEEEPPMTDERLLQFLLLAGDGAFSLSFVNGEREGGEDGVGEEQGQRLPKELRGVMERWRREEGERRERDTAAEEGQGKVKRTKTV